VQEQGIVRWERATHRRQLCHHPAVIPWQRATGGGVYSATSGAFPATIVSAIERATAVALAGIEDTQIADRRKSMSALGAARSRHMAPSAGKVGARGLPTPRGTP